jgi:hypothetical protein
LVSLPHDVGVSFDLHVLAIDPSANLEAVQAMVERCQRWPHPEGDLDSRIVGFYEDLQSGHPDHPPYPDDSPWMSMPLDVGVDHVMMNLSYSRRSDGAIRAVTRLARRYELIIYDPQFEEIFHPSGQPTCHGSLHCD